MSEPQITYRYKCATEGGAVYETRNISDGAPTVCKHGHGAFVAGSLTILEQPLSVDDLFVNQHVDFTDAVVTNLSHASLTNIGTHTHAEIDTHIDDATLHRQINDTGSSSTDLWSAEKILSTVGNYAIARHTHTVADITDYTVSTENIADQRISDQKGLANGLASLDANGKVPVSQIPLTGGVVYQGTWDASTNTPTLTSGVGTQGFYYVVNVDGTTNLDGITDWSNHDWAIFNGKYPLSMFVV